MVDVPGWSLPALDDTNRAWFTSGALALQRCTACATVQHPPEEICHRCGSMDFDHLVVAPRGTIHSHTVVHHAAHPALADAVPYTVVLVRLDDAPDVRVVGNLDPGPDPTIGMPVEAYWASHDHDGTTLHIPQWRAITDAQPDEEERT